MSILVTGGGSGIGLGTARYCIERRGKGHDMRRREDKIQAAAAELGDACRGVTADITVASDRQKLLEAAIDHGGQLDALINNAGNMYRGAITELDEAALQEVFHTNVIAAMMLTGLCTPSLAQQQGAVVFVGSIHTRRAFPGASPYAATKAAVQGLTRVLAAELGEQKDSRKLPAARRGVHGNQPACWPHGRRNGVAKTGGNVRLARLGPDRHHRRNCRSHGLPDLRRMGHRRHD